MTINLNEILPVFPELLSYLVPGYMFWYFYEFATKTIQSVENPLKILAWKNVAVSFILQVILRIVISASPDQYINFARYLVFGMLAGALCGLVMGSHRVEQFIREYFSIQNTDTVWEAIVDPDNGNFTTVRVDGKVYSGTMAGNYHHNGEHWIVLEDYTVDGVQPDNYQVKQIALNINDVKWIETEFESDSIQLMYKGHPDNYE